MVYPKKYNGIPWHTMGYLSSTTYHGIPRYTMVYHGIPSYTMVYFCTPWYTMVYNSTNVVYHVYTMLYHGIPWYTMVYNGIPWYTMVYDGIPISIRDRIPRYHLNGIMTVYHGIPWFRWYTMYTVVFHGKCDGIHGIPWYAPRQKKKYMHFLRSDAAVKLSNKATALVRTVMTLAT